MLRRIDDVPRHIDDLLLRIDDPLRRRSIASKWRNKASIFRNEFAKWGEVSDIHRSEKTGLIQVFGSVLAPEFLFGIQKN
jgi:hypothetical protein